jgi:Tol biopolymer transport system component
MPWPTRPRRGRVRVSASSCRFATTRSLLQLPQGNCHGVPRSSRATTSRTASSLPLNGTLSWRSPWRVLALTLALSASFCSFANNATAGRPEDRLYYSNSPSQQLVARDLDTGTESILTEGADLLSVAPDDQAITYKDAFSGDLSIVGRDGTGKRTLVPNNYQGALWSFPQFSPDNENVLVMRRTLNPLELDIYAVSRASDPSAPVTRPVVTWPGQQREALLTPDGRKLIVTSKPPGGSDADWSIYVAEPDGSNPVRLAAADVLSDPFAYYPSISPDGRTIVFQADSSPPNFRTDIYAIDIDGTNFRQLTNTPETPEQHPVWSPDGTRIFYSNGGPIYSMAPDGSDRRPVEGANGAHPAFRQPSNSFNVAAAMFRPVLRFDSSEDWRPLDVDRFFAEGQHKICDAQGCDEQPITTAADLQRHATASSYIDIAGSFHVSGDEANYTSPNPFCRSADRPRRDCDTGPASAIYYRLAPQLYGGYQYIDYWFFYRANYFLDTFGFHEGDWEAVTVAPAPGWETFDYAAFSQHGGFYAYLRDVLRCEDSPASEVPPRGSCGAASKRIATMVANGSHANYTTPCSELIPAVSCSSNGGSGRERGYDGQRRWGRAFEDPGISLWRMPSTGPGNWTDWPGKWGWDHGPFGETPRSPGMQPVSVSCAVIDNDPVNCDEGPRTAARRLRGTATVRGGSPGLAALSCQSWAGAGIGAAVCEPRRLRRAVLRRELGRHGTTKVSVAGRRGMAASAPGITQLSTARPLSDGSRLRIRGRLSRATRVLVRAVDRTRKRLIVAEFRPGARRRELVAPSRRRTTRLRLAIRASSQGQPRVSLGRTRPVRLRVVRLRRR